MSEEYGKRLEESYKKFHNAGFDEAFIRVRLDQGFEIRQSPKGTLFAIKNIRFDKSDDPNILSVTSDMAGDLTEAKNFLRKNMELIIENLQSNGKCSLDELDDALKRGVEE